MKSISKLAVLSATLSITLLTANASANSISGTGEDYEIVAKGSSVHVKGNSGFVSAFTEGEGSDLNRVRVESIIYVNGQKQSPTLVGSGTSYASVDYDANPTRLTSLRISSTHFAYNKVNEYKRSTSSDQWP
ncbi:hypothetical protein T458_16770 [Brevibacillus panacihumi W25]|uniref:Pectate lyase n=1 Tax=Brevibacillus panacihumi W25 TaxID=1408254 RepID=V6M2R6_9BACL|nr:hypothetical protein [Brevibacillus panacihumi]EST52622.1 hypothetical protein T458_16770 [Brevibacillus panacihumi W25]